MIKDTEIIHSCLSACLIKNQGMVEILTRFCFYLLSAGKLRYELYRLHYDKIKQGEMNQ